MTALPRLPEMTWVVPETIDDRLDPRPFQRSVQIPISAVRSAGFDLVRLGASSATSFLNRGVGGAVDTLTSCRLFKSRSVRDGYMTTDADYLPDARASRLGKKQLLPGDVVLTSSGLGTIGRAALFLSSERATVDNHVSIIRCRSTKLHGGYLTAYLNSRFGQAWCTWGTTGSTGQLELNRDRVAEFQVPLPDRFIQKYIGAKVELAERCRGQAGTLCAQAIARFDALLRTTEFRPDGGLTNVVDARALTERLTGEFYLPRYFALEAHLARLGVPAKPLRSLLRSDIIRSSTPERDRTANVPCILTSDIDPHEIRWRDPSLRTSQSVHDRHSGRLTARDVVYTSVGPPVGEAALVLPQFLPMAAGGDVSILRHGDNLHPGFLALYLNSMFGQMQNDRYSRGIRQRRVYPGDIGAFLIPAFGAEDQAYVGERIIRHQVLNELAVDLVNEAKADVEALIEGTLDVDAILAGTVKAPTADDIPELTEDAA